MLPRRLRCSAHHDHVAGSQRPFQRLIALVPLLGAHEEVARRAEAERGDRWQRPEERFAVAVISDRVLAVLVCPVSPARSDASAQRFTRQKLKRAPVRRSTSALSAARTGGMTRGRRWYELSWAGVAGVTPSVQSMPKTLVQRGVVTSAGQASERDQLRTDTARIVADLQ